MNSKIIHLIIIAMAAGFAIILVPLLSVLAGLKIYGLEAVANKFDSVIAVLPIYGGVAFVIWMAAWMWVPERFAVVGPPPGASPLSQRELTSRLSQTFRQPLFTVDQDSGRMLITWENALTSNQIANQSQHRMKRVFILNFDEASRSVLLTMRSMDFNRQVSLSGLGMSAQYSRGLMAEYNLEHSPSVVFKDDGTISFDINKIRYSSAEILGPIEKVVTEAGWTLRGSVIPKREHKLIVMALSASLGAFMIFSLGYLFKQVRMFVRARPSVGADIKTPGDDRQFAVLEKNFDAMTPEQVRLIKPSLETYLKLPLENLPDDSKRYMRLYFSTYISKAEGDEQFKKTLRRRLEEIK